MNVWVILITCLLGLPAISLAAEPIKVGATVSLSGEYAPLGREQLNGMQMWTDDLNARGALLGRKVELVHYDDRSDSETSARLYERLIRDDQIDLLLGPYSSELTLAASTVAEQHAFPMVATGASAGEIWSRGYRNIFGTDTPTSDYMDTLLEFVKKKGLQRVALIYASTGFAREIAAGVRNEAANYGFTIVFEEEYNRDWPHFARLIQRLRQSNPEVVIGGSYLDDSVAFVREANARRVSPKLLAFTVGPALPEFGERLGPAAEGVMGVVQWLPSARLPMARDFAYRYQRKFGYDAGPHAALGYSAGQVLEAAVRLAGSLDKDQIREQLRSLKFRSLMGFYRVDETGKQVGKENYVLQWQDGRRRLVLPEAIAESPVDYPFNRR